MSVFSKNDWRPVKCPHCGKPMLYATNETLTDTEIDREGNWRMVLPLYAACPDCLDKWYPEKVTK